MFSTVGKSEQPLTGGFLKCDYLTLHAMISRFLAAVLVVQWYLLFVHSSTPELKFSFEYLRYSGSISVGANLGLWLSSTKWAATHRIIVSFLLLPSLVAPLFLASNILHIASIFGVVLWSYWIVLKRKRMRL